MRFRGKSIRRKIVGLLLVPMVSLTAIWTFATVITGREARQLLNVAEAVDKLGDPTEDTVQVIQQERRQTLVYLADPRRSDALTQLHRRTQATDKAVARLRDSASDADLRDNMNSAAAGEFASVLRGLDGLDSLRREVEDGTISLHHAFAAYNEIVDPCYAFVSALEALDNIEMEQQARALVGVTRAREALSREDALFASALVAGHMSKRDLRSFADRVAERNILYATNLPVLPAQDAAIFDRFWRSPGTQQLRSFEDAVIAARPEEAVDAVNAERWQAATSTVLDTLDRMDTEAGDRYRDRVEPVAMGVLMKAGIAGALGFLALVLSLVVSVRIGRRLVRDLTRLRKDAHEISGVRLPSVMRRLAAGEQVDVETEAPRLDYGPDETGQVGQALSTLQRAAVEAAVKQAQMRRGVSDVFVNLARRNQVLLHRQLTLLDAMERRTEDAEELADLFRLDHLTTRMRRHAEGLVILSGAAPSRQWRKPIQLMDVVRAAVAEVEDYERIEVRRLPRLAVTGAAVADLTHLIAELLENATVFSPPHTVVQVLGERVANGFTLEIHDRGLGLAPEALLDANLRLAETPDFELSDTDRLGLFVVSRLARRQGLRVSLQPSPYGGTTAVVFIPAAVLTEHDTLSGGPSRSGAEERTGEQPLPDGKPAVLAPLPVLLDDLPPDPEPALDRPLKPAAPLGAFRGDGEDGLPPRGRTRDLDRVREQHQQARDRAGEGNEPARPSGPVPLPRRRSPMLVSDHGRPVQTPGGGQLPEDTSGRPGGLPRRVRQASLAPQLKAEPDSRADKDTEAADFAPGFERDAEEVRSRMASLQRGWQRGRAHTGEEPGTARDTAPEPRSEGDGR
jgi:signal transduction histidine kinase